MTETLSRLLRERADAVRLDPVDLDAVARAGSRTVRRRRWAACAAAAAAMAVVGGIVAVVRAEPSTPEPVDPIPPVVRDTTALSWASGDVLHTLSGDIDVGHEIWSFARSEVGYVVASRKKVYSVVDGEVRLIGTVRDTPLVYGDTDGTLVAWGTSGPSSTYGVRDQADGADLSVTATSPGHVRDLDGRTLYVDQTQERVTSVQAVNVDTGERTVVAGRPIAIEDGVVAQPGEFGSEPPLLSPTAAWAAIDDGDVVQVVDVATAEPISFSIAASRAIGYEWVDDDSLAVLAIDLVADPNGGASQLLECHVSTRSCQVAVPSLGDGNVVLPGGRIAAPRFPQ